MAATQPTGQPLLEIRNLTMTFGGLVAVHDLSLTVYPGEIVGLIGPNGAGKSTVFNCISRFYNPVAGSIHVAPPGDGAAHDITDVGPHDIIRYGIARTFQNVELCRSMTTFENLLVGQHTAFVGNIATAGLRLPGLRRQEEAARTRADEVLALLGLEAYRDRVVASLPFGAQKLTELARALVARPRLLLLDEPAAGADSHETEHLVDLLRRIRDLFDLTMLLVEHDMSVVMGLCDRLYVLDFGKTIAEGVPDDIQRHPAVIEAYLGERAPGGLAASA